MCCLEIYPGPTEIPGDPATASPCSPWSPSRPIYLGWRFEADVSSGSKSDQPSCSSPPPELCIPRVARRSKFRRADAVGDSHGNDKHLITIAMIIISITTIVIAIIW